jgi:phage-related minor tail protein
VAEFQIGSAFVSIGARLDEGQVNQQTNAMGGRLAAWAGGLGLGAIISKGIADNLNITAANAKLSAQMGLTAGEAKKAGDAAGSVYRDGFGASIADVNTAIKGVGQNMVDLKNVSKPQLEQLTKGALGISEAFDVDVNDSTRAAGALMKSGLAKDGKQALDIITKGFQLGMDSSGDWLDTLNEYSPQFAKIGVDGPTALSAINQFMKAGVRDTDAAADAFKEFGLRAIDTAQPVTDAYKGLGLDADKMRKNIAAGGPTSLKAMQQVFDALQKVKDPVKQNQLGTALMGTQWEDTVRAILPEIDLTKGSITDVAGATDKMNKKLHDTPQARLEKMKREAEGLLAKVTQLPGPFAEVGAAMVSFGPQLLSMGASLALIGPAMAPAIAATWAWTTALLANPVTWIVIGIIALVAAIVLIATKTDWFQKLWKAVWGGIKSFLSATWDGIKAVFSAIGDFFTKTIPGWANSLKDKITGAWNSIKSGTSRIWNGIKDWISKAFDFLKSLFLNFTGPGLIIKHWDKIKSATGAAWTWVKNKISDLLNGTKQIISSVTGAISSRISSIWGTIKNATSAAWSWIKSKISEGINAARNAVLTAVGRIASTVSGIKGKVMNALSGAASWLRESGKKIIRGLIDGIKNMAGNVKSAVKGVLSDARDLLPFSPAKEGPFSGKGWTLYSGQSMMTGLAEGIDQKGYQVKRSMEGALAPAQAATSISGPVGATPRAGTHIENLTVKVEGSFDMASPAQRRRVAHLLAEEISEALRRRERERA